MRIAVLGIGNVLVGDDGFGPYVVKTFEARYTVAPNVEVAEVGTPGGDLVPYLSGYDAVIIVDTVRASAEPGTVRVYTKEELLRNPPGPRTNTHDPGLKDTLLMLEAHGSGPAEVVLVGAVPENVTTRTGLTPPLARAVDEAVAHIEVELAKLGYPPMPRPAPLEPDIWWERRVDRSRG